MHEVLAQREAIAAIAQRHAPSRRYWTVVGNGLNRIAANEVRIKLSELCYQSISSDIAEDKKHIDLCTEPLILVCAVGLRWLERRRRRQGGRVPPRAPRRADRDHHRGRGPLLQRAGDDLRAAGASRPRVRALGHGGPPVRLRSRARRSTRRRGRCAEARAAIQAVVAGAVAHRRRLLTTWPVSSRAGGACSSTARAPAATTATSPPAPRCSSRRCCATRPAIMPLDLYEVDHGKVGTPSTVVEDLTAALTQAINELTRTDRHHQAPGQDGHRRHLALRRGAAARRAGASRCSPPAPHATR